MFDAIARILFHPPRISHRVKTVLDVNAGGEPAAEGEMHGRPKAAQNKTTANKPLVFGEDSMSFAGSKRIRHLEYFLLHDARPTGPSVGLYANRDIPASVVDDFGRRYLFAGIAPRQWNGDFDLDALQTGEFILKPGLVYRLEQLPRSWIESLFG